ncbi:MAG: lipoyl(octanoyl) transferase LipB [Rhodoferax sp.]
MDVVSLGRVDYAATFAAMQAYSRNRATPERAHLPDVLWMCEHNPVFTQGVAGRSEHLLNPGGIPIVQTDRGGQVTYHGPGQVVAYPLLDLKRAGYFVKEYVYRLEEALIRTLLHFGVTGHRVGGAPGIYVNMNDPFGHSVLPQRPQKLQTGKPVPDFAGLAKIAALGIKISRNFAYHGAALNVAMDLAPFHSINPCGYAALQTVDLSTIGVRVDMAEVEDVLAKKLVNHLLP